MNEGWDTEKILEDNLINTLNKFGYEITEIKNEDSLKENLKKQLELFNKISFSNEEFESLYTWLNNGDVFERSSRIRNDAFLLERGKEKFNIRFLDDKKWCENIYQVVNQFIDKNNDVKNRYDVTILVNGLPLVQIELKKQGTDLKEAFNQINRYKRTSFNNLFKFIQIFIISNGNETKYFATNEDSEHESNYKFAFKWSDQLNKPISSLLNNYEGKKSFANCFLNKCQLGKMITKYMIIQKDTKEIKVLRPYQYHAIELTLDLIKNTNNSGFIWHTTGSGKTLTSFKLAQEVKNNVNKISKVFFVVDRRDLNSQTITEFSRFDKDEDILNIERTESLIDSILDDKNQLVVTTIQKFDRAIKKIESDYFGKNINQDKLNRVKKAKNNNVVIIFDEAHRSQSGDSNRLIRKFFNNLQMIGFTGTPIKVKNLVNNQTTEEIFGKMIHSYTISEAINDKNVLGFMVQYMKTFGIKENYSEDDDQLVKGIDKKGVWDSDIRIAGIVENILKIHPEQTKGKYNAMLTVNSIEALKKYYLEFKKQNELLPEDKKLNISAIYSITDNEDFEGKETLSTDFLKEIVKDFVAFSGQKININSDKWYEVFRNKLIQSIKNNRTNDVDIVIVVNMLTTGFDSKLLNTLYVDKDLKYHSLLQTFSRTNRIHESTKTQGNIICYSRPNKEKVDTSIAEYSNVDNLSVVIKDDYWKYVKEFNEKYKALTNEFSSIDEISSLTDYDKKYEYVKLFKDLASEYNMARSFFDFSYNHLNCSKQDYEVYKREYLNIYREREENDDEKVSILNKIDFEIELINKDIIDAKYIQKYLSKYQQNLKESEYRKIMHELNSELKKSIYPQRLIDLITEFVNKQLDNLEIEDGIVQKYINYDDLTDFLNNHKKNEFEKIINEYNLPKDDFFRIIKKYEETSYLPGKEIRNLIKINNKRQEIEKKNIDWFDYQQEAKIDIINSIEYIYNSIRM